LRSIKQDTKDTPNTSNNLLDIEIKKYVLLRAKDMEDLFGIAYYAGIESGRHKIRDKTLDDLEAQEKRERSEAQKQTLEILSALGAI